MPFRSGLDSTIGVRRRRKHANGQVRVSAARDIIPNLFRFGIILSIGEFVQSWCVDAHHIWRSGVLGQPTDSARYAPCPVIASSVETGESERSSTLTAACWRERELRSA